MGDSSGVSYSSLLLATIMCSMDSPGDYPTLREGLSDVRYLRNVMAIVCMFSRCSLLT